MFDGLDEVPHAGERRKRLISCIDAFVKSFHKARFLVTCRPYAYEKAEWKLAGFAESHLADFNQGQIIRFIQQWYSHSPEFTADSATQRAGRLQRAVLGRDSLRKLGERPLLLSLIAYLDANRYELPERRADLYEKLLDLLNDEWEKARFKANDGADALKCEQHSLANVWEWTRSERGDYPYPVVGTKEWKKRSSANGKRAVCVLRGGAFGSGQRYVRSSVRYNPEQVVRDGNVGFRCCVVPITLTSETSGR